MGRERIITLTKLVDEPWFSEDAHNLKRNGVQVATITSVDAVRLERRTQAKPEVWATQDGVTFGATSIYDGDGTASLIGGTINADKDADPPGGAEYVYQIVAECTITFTEAFGGGTAGHVVRQRCRIVATAEIAA